MSSDISQNNKRIAKNTLALYFRTFITMIVGLYTGRVMLQALGVDNYGINAVVGGDSGNEFTYYLYNVSSYRTIYHLCTG